MPVKIQIMFSCFYRHYISPQVLEYITSFFISPVLFLFPSSHLISTLFLHLQSHQIIHFFFFFSLFEGTVASIPNAIQAVFHTFQKENFSSSFRLLPIFKILGLLIQILSKSTVKQFTIFCFCCQKDFLTLEFSYWSVYHHCLKICPFFTSILIINGLMSPISQRYCAELPWLQWKTSSVCLWQNGVAAVIQDCWKTALVKQDTCHMKANTVWMHPRGQ